MTIFGLPALHRRLGAISGLDADRRMLQMVALRTQREAKLLAPRKTGYLGRSIVLGSNDGRHARVVARAGYAAYVEHGTGLYGPRHKRIVPVRAKVLAWRTGEVRLSGRSRTRGGSELAGWAFARSVAGRRATPFLVPGARKAAAQSGLAEVVVKEWNGAA